MKIAVRYASRGGNTKKVADAMAQAVGVTAQTVEVALTEKVDVLLLGGALYAGGVDESLTQFAEKLSPDMVGKVALFSTAVSPKGIAPKVEPILSAKGIPVEANEFHVRSKFLFMKRGHPNAQDLEDAAAFAKGLQGEPSV